MHRCLAVEDIVEEILHYAETGSTVVGTKRAPSFVLMQACKSFYQPACNVRWSTLVAFSPLVRLFSQGAVGKGPTTLEVGLELGASSVRADLYADRSTVQSIGNAFGTTRDA